MERKKRKGRSDSPKRRKKQAAQDIPNEAVDSNPVKASSQLLLEADQLENPQLHLMEDVAIRGAIYTLNYKWDTAPHVKMSTDKIVFDRNCFDENNIEEADLVTGELSEVLRTRIEEISSMFLKKRPVAVPELFRKDIASLLEFSEVFAADFLPEFGIEEGMNEEFIALVGAARVKYDDLHKPGVNEATTFTQLWSKLIFEPFNIVCGKDQRSRFHRMVDADPQFEIPIRLGDNVPKLFSIRPDSMVCFKGRDMLFVLSLSENKGSTDAPAIARNVAKAVLLSFFAWKQQQNFVNKQYEEAERTRKRKAIVIPFHTCELSTGIIRLFAFFEHPEIDYKFHYSLISSFEVSKWGPEVVDCLCVSLNVADWLFAQWKGVHKIKYRGPIAVERTVLGRGFAKSSSPSKKGDTRNSKTHQGAEERITGDGANAVLPRKAAFAFFYNEISQLPLSDFVVFDRAYQAWLSEDGPYVQRAYHATLRMRVILKLCISDRGDWKQLTELRALGFHRCPEPIYLLQNIKVAGYVGYIQSDCGSTLRDMLEKADGLGLVDGFLGAMEAVSDLHDIGFIHRDLKDDNIAVDPRTGKVCLIDFEFAVRLDENGVYRTQRKELRRRRLSPEAQEGLFSRDSDVYALIKLGEKILDGCKEMPAEERHIFQSIIDKYDVEQPREMRISARELYGLGRSELALENEKSLRRRLVAGGDDEAQVKHGAPNGRVLAH
ncbi:hypothetical protein HDU97_008889 [Phlyctochytrium planicorne]|nr:hypothetical protein HDU97_008889 [Phlyctochytrium planicorne]